MLIKGRVFSVGQTNLTAFLQTNFAAASALIPAIAAAYSVGSPGITNGYDAISAVTTDVTFQCVSIVRIRPQLYF